MKLFITFVAPSTSFCGSVGYTVAVSNNFPFWSITANLHPVLYAGSNPNTVIFFIGACNNSCFAFLPNTFMAFSSAFSDNSFLNSLSTDGSIKRLYESSILSYNILPNWLFLSFMMSFSIKSITFSSGFSTLTFRYSSFSPLLIANILWLGKLLKDSLKS